MLTGLFALLALFAILYGLNYLGSRRINHEDFRGYTDALTSRDQYKQLHKNYHDAIEIAKYARVNPGSKYVNNLQPHLLNKSYGHHTAVRLPVYKCKWAPSAIMRRVATLQPNYLGKNAVIVNGEYYHDQRYQNKPVHIDFAMDPETYSTKHPNVYPSYLWISVDSGTPHTSNTLPDEPGYSLSN